MKTKVILFSLFILLFTMVFVQAGEGGLNPPIESRYDFELYGSIRLDAIWSSSKVAGLDGVSFWATERYSDSEFCMTARATRLGLNIAGPEDDTIRQSGKIEMDFYGHSDMPERQDRGHMRIRHAYLQLDFPNDWSLLAGQTWDVVSPIAPKVLDLSVRSQGGKIGFRSPQLRLTHLCRIHEDEAFKTELALSTPKDVTTRYGDYQASGTRGFGQDSGIPVVQARTSYQFLNWKGQPTEIGISGHYGRKQYHEPQRADDAVPDSAIVDVSSHKKNADTWSLNLDFQLAWNDLFRFMAAGHYGKNLEMMYGGIGEGVAIRESNVFPDPAGDIVHDFEIYEITSYGGWAQLLYSINEQWETSVGITYARNNEWAMNRIPQEYRPTDFRIRNTAPFANVFYQVTEAVSTGFEVTRLMTDYYEQDSCAATRYQFSMSYTF